MSAAPAVIRGETSVSWHNRRSVSDVAPRLAVATPAVVLVAAGDPRSSRIVYAMVVGLVVIGVALVLLGVWLVRQTRPDLEVLAPLERMGDGDWKKRDPSTQRRMLDEVRPEGAQPLTPEPKPPPIDAEFEADHPVASFSDLGPGLVAEHRDPTPVAADQLDTDTDVDVDDAEARPRSTSIPATPRTTRPRPRATPARWTAMPRTSRLPATSRPSAMARKAPTATPRRSTMWTMWTMRRCPIHAGDC
jgi:FtsZ-interacting cell division protein ZipA